MYFITIIVSNAIKKSLQQTKFLKLAVVYCVVYHDCRFSHLRRMSLETNMKTMERIKWGTLESSSRKAPSACGSEDRGWSACSVGLSHIIVKKLLTFQKFVEVICLWSTSLDEAGTYSRPEVPSVRAGMWCQIPATTKWFLLMLKGIPPTSLYLWSWQYLKYSDVRFFLLID